MIKNFLQKWWQAQFGSQQLLQLILQQQHGELIEADENRIKKWVDRDYLRKLAYQNFTILLKYRKRVNDAHKHDIREVLKDLQKILPNLFGEINGAATEFTLRTTLVATLDQAMFQMANLVVFGFIWLTIVILLLRLLVMLLACFIVFAMVK